MISFRTRERIAYGGGVVGAVLAALCCAGTPVIVSALAAAGVGFLRRDAILLPPMLVSLLVTLWGLRRAAQRHGRRGPLWLSAGGSISLVIGVMFVHGPPAMALIDAGALGLVAGTLWNVAAQRARTPRRGAPLES